MTSFLKQTPAQAAGLVAGGPTAEDKQAWADYMSSPDRLAAKAARVAAQLARKRELLALRERELQALGKQTVEISKAAAEAGARIKVTELAWRSAIAAARLLPLWAPESTPALDTLNRELRELIDPRLDQLIEWVDFEDECTAAYGPPTVFEDIPGYRPGTKRVHGDPSIRQVVDGLLQRRAALRAARYAFEALKFEVLEEPEFIKACQEILATVPELPAGVSQIGPLPRAHQGATGVPNSVVSAKREQLAVIGTQHVQARAAKTKGWLRR